MNTSANQSTRSGHLALFGATRGIGRHVLDQALAAGHHVTALVRDPTRLDVRHPHLRVRTGDVTELAAVSPVVQGADAVICALGAPARDRRGVRAAGTRQIVRAMEDHGVRRLLCVSVLGASETRASLPFLLRRIVFPLVLDPAVRDHEAQEQLIAASDTDWTVVRPPTLTDGPRTGRYAHGFGTDFGGLTMKVSRADVADFLLREIDRDRYVRRMPGVSYAKSSAAASLALTS